jgi:predicted extracellular nuclease
LRGFYIQDLIGDGNPATSDGIFVFNGNNNSVSLGDIVYVTGTVSEFQDQTQIGGTVAVTKCGTGTVAPVDVTFPVASPTFLEQYEGMLVRLPQTLSVTEHFQLGRFGQVVLSADGRLPQPTNVIDPGPLANALQADNDLHKIILDDDSQAQNPDPILFGRGGSPLSAINTLRGGDTVTNIVGVMTYTWAGNAASGNAYRVRPINALGGTIPNFQASNPRPSSVPNVGGSVRVVGMNLLNFFNTFDGASSNPPYACNLGVGGPLTDCRGADDIGEFDRQWPKTVAAILAMNPDVLGVNELENDGYGSDSAIQFLVDKLNAATAPGTYAFINVDAATGQVNALGTDAIKVSLLYKPSVVTPVGTTAVLNSVAFVNGGDGAPRSRPSLAQAFSVNATGAVFIVDVNHLKSKGSACDDPDAGDGQGNCNEVRTAAVEELLAWLATDPTGTGDPDMLLIGDYNSYAKEDPITTIENAGFTNLIEQFLGITAYSYVFDGQWGYLDHALASASLVSQVTGVGDYHINSDEPSVLDYNDDFKSAGQIVSLYTPDQFRVSDHDPVVIGLAPYVPFANVSASLEVDGKGKAAKGSLEYKLTFTLGAGNNGITPLIEPVIVQIGNISLTIPPGSFKGNKKEKYTFEGKLNGASIEASITPVSSGRYELKLHAESLDVTSLTSPVTTQVRIGNDNGTVTIPIKK